MTETFSNLRLGIVFIAFFFFSFEIKYYLVVINKRYALFRGKLLRKFCACLRRRKPLLCAKSDAVPVGTSQICFGAEFILLQSAQIPRFVLVIELVQVLV